MPSHSVRTLPSIFLKKRYSPALFWGAPAAVFGKITGINAPGTWAYLPYPSLLLLTYSHTMTKKKSMRCQHSDSFRILCNMCCKINPSEMSEQTHILLHTIVILCLEKRILLQWFSNWFLFWIDEFLYVNLECVVGGVCECLSEIVTIYLTASLTHLFATWGIEYRVLLCHSLTYSLVACRWMVVVAHLLWWIQEGRASLEIEHRNTTHLLIDTPITSFFWWYVNYW